MKNELTIQTWQDAIDKKVSEILKNEDSKTLDVPLDQLDKMLKDYERDKKISWQKIIKYYLKVVFLP